MALEGSNSSPSAYEEVIRTQSQSHNSCTWWKDEGQCPKLRTREVHAIYKEKPFPMRTAQHWSRLARDVVRFPSLEVLKT